MSEPASVINVKNLRYSYGTGTLKREALKGVDLEIEKGEIVILTGPSGSGKTTLLTIIGGLRTAFDGSVEVLGEQMIGSNENTRVTLRKHIGFIFQQHNLLKSLTALQNVCMALELRDGFNEQDRQKIAGEILGSVGLSDFLHKKPDQLSGGQKQRVSVA
ncbi:MAG: ATP-binding cassette domain-containing protein, partial [Alphaproteobacteria bacterium]|nr:ATP-binding cassette domain-containing protein [Alphaproteobacteria bacterium]